MRKTRFSGRAISLLICAALLFMPSTSSGEGLTFAEAARLLRKSNESLMAAQAELDQRSREKEAARGLYLPKVHAGGRYTRLDEPIMIDLNDIRSAMLRLHPNVPAPAVPLFELQVQDDAFWKANVSATWTIFAGGQIIAANRAADAFVADAREKKRAMESVLESELVRRYFGVRLAGILAKTRAEEFESLDRHLARVRKLEEAGMVAHVETLHAEVARSEADRQRKGALRDEEIARTALANLVAGEKDIEPVTSLFIIHDIAPLENFRSSALRNNPNLKQIYAQKEAAHQSYRKEVGSLAPQIMFFGQRELHREDLTILEPEWFYGLGVNFSIFEGGASINRIRAAKAVENKVAHLETQARRDLEMLVDRRYQELMKAIEEYDALAASVAAAEEYLRVRMRSLEEGYATSLDVVDARLALTRALTGKAIAAYRTDCALAELLEASGMSEQFEAYRDRANMGAES